MSVFCRVASIARLPILDPFSRIYHTQRGWILRRIGLFVRLPEGPFVLAGVVDQGVSLVEGVACGYLTDDQGVVAGARSVYDLAVEVGQAVEEERRAPRRQ